MLKFNFLQYPKVSQAVINPNISLQALHTNDKANELMHQFKHHFGFEFLYGFSFTKEGFLALFLSLKGKIAVSLGESEALIQAAKTYKELGFELDFIALQHNGLLDYESIKACDYAFVSSYIMDTFVKVDLEKVKILSGATLVSNITATLSNKHSDMVYFDSYKLTGFATHSFMLHQGILKEQSLGDIDTVGLSLLWESIQTFCVETSFKKRLKELLDETFKENIFYFVDSNTTLEYTLHFGLKGIKAREIIRTLSLNDIYVSNGEGCSLGLGKPSRILQEMGYEEFQARWALSLNFSENISDEQLNHFVQILAKKYRQIKALGQ
jgi:hypothetical protein